MSIQSAVFHSPACRDAVLSRYDLLLREAAGGLETLRVHTRFGETFLLAAGEKDAPPLVLLHGSSMNSAMWAKDMQVLGQAFRVYAPDLPGEPGRSAEIQLPFDTNDYADWLLDVFAGLSIDRAALAGISLGAWLSVRFAVLYPQRVSRLVLLCPAGIGPQNHAFKDIALSLLSKGEQGLDELFQAINGGEPIPQAVLDYQKLIASCFRTRTETIPLFTDDELGRLTMPSALFFGENDIMLCAREAVERYRQLLPQGRATLLTGRGHSLTGLAQEMLGFLRED